jgi:metal-dependent HD superfamily phosphatase/phosphodiesterase
MTPAEAVRDMRVNLPARGNRTLREIVDRVNRDDSLKALWHAANVNAVARMHINDHSWVHIQIVSNIGLKLLRELRRAGVEPGMVKDYGMRQEDAEAVVVLGCLTHCLGMAIHRQNHEEMSLFLAADRLPRLLDGIYDEPERTIVQAEVLQTIISHRSDGQPLSVEAGVVRVADALDMAKGRSRIPFESGRVSIHSLSAAAIEEVNIRPADSGGRVLVQIMMNNSAGLYQVDNLLKSKLRGSGLEEHIEVEAAIEGETEKRLLSTFRL